MAITSRMAPLFSQELSNVEQAANSTAAGGHPFSLSLSLSALATYPAEYSGTYIVNNVQRPEHTVISYHISCQYAGTLRSECPFQISFGRWLRFQ